MARQVEIFERTIIADGTQSTFSFNTVLADTGNIDIIPSETIFDPTIGEDLKNYEFVVGSEGAATGGSVTLHHRSIVIQHSVSPQQPILITSFFNAITSGFLKVFPRYSASGITTYDVFWIAGISAAPLTLRVFSVENPSTTAITFTTIGNRDYQFIRNNSDGRIKKYDFFSLEIP